MSRRRSRSKRSAVLLLGAVWCAQVDGVADAVPRVPVDVEPRSGTATFTDLTGGGACSFPGEPPDNLHVGISTAEYGTADACGGYMDVVGPEGTVRVKITDHCRNCRPGVIDITRKAFDRIADVDQGRAPVTYGLVRDPPLTEPMSLRLKAGSSRWWLQVQVLDHGNPLAGVELGVGDGWRALARTSDNHWTASTPGPGDGPFTVRITDIYGQSATIFDVALAPGRVQHTVARLYQPDAVPAPPTSSAPTSSSLAPPASVLPPAVSPVTPPTPVTPVTPSTPAPGMTPSPGGAGDDAVTAPAAPPRSSRGAASLAPLFVLLTAIAVAMKIHLRRTRPRRG